MNNESIVEDGAVYQRLKNTADANGSGWELLFDRSERLINTEVDELPEEASVAHPLLDFYSGKTETLLGQGFSAFIPYKASTPVISSDIVIDIFTKAGAGKRVPKFRLAGTRERLKLNPRGLTIGIVVAESSAPGTNLLVDSIVKKHSMLATSAGAARQADGSIDGLTILGYTGGFFGLGKNAKRRLGFSETDKVALDAGNLLKFDPMTSGVRRVSPQEVAGSAATLAAEAVEGIKRDGLDVLYVAGGHQAMVVTDALCDLLKGIRGPQGKPVRAVVAPQSVHNAVNFTDATFGFQTATDNASEIINRTHVEAETAGAIAILEFPGLNSGILALYAARPTGNVDFVLIPEMLERSPQGAAFKAVVSRLMSRYEKNGHALIVVTEGAVNAVLRQQVGKIEKDSFSAFVELLESKLKLAPLHVAVPRIVTMQPKHLLAATEPNSYDANLCKDTGYLMVETALGGFSRCVVALWRGQMTMIPIKLAISEIKQVNVNNYSFLSLVEKYLLTEPRSLSNRPQRDATAEFDPLG